MKKLFFFLTLVLLTMMNARPTEAHFLVVDNHIGAVLHVDPNDEPVAGEQASFFFEFKDKDNKFQPAHCSCTFSILENGKEMFSQPLFQNNQNPSLSNASVFYIFPQRDVYEIKVTGKPFVAHAFQDFTLTYDLRVANIADPTTSANTSSQNASWFSTHVVHLAIGIIIIILGIIFLIQKNIKKHEGKKKKSGKEEKNPSNLY